MKRHIVLYLGSSGDHRKGCPSYLSTFLPFYLFTFILFFLTSCGVDSDRFRLEGRLRNMNQGEFWVYSIDGGVTGIDTIPVREGRFSYETELRIPTTLVIIFPNYSEQPVFARPGKVVTIKGDASHLKDMTIKGTDDNDDMTKLRMELNRLMPPEIPKAVETFIRKHPESMVSCYLLQHYFIMDMQADYRKARELAMLMQKKQPGNVQLGEWKKQLDGLQNGQPKSRVPAFSAVDVKGKQVTQALLKSQVNVVSVWASWSYPSTDMQRRLQKVKKEHGNKLSIVSICLDANPKVCKERISRDSLTWPTICDGRLWQSPLVAKLGISDIPANLIIDSKGSIVERNLTPEKLEEKLKELLK